jgi:hypothetical protein
LERKVSRAADFPDPNLQKSSGIRAKDRFVPGKSVALSPVVHRHLEYFSLGGVIALVWAPRSPMLPWVVASMSLVTLGAWSMVTAAGRGDCVLLGSIAAYELIIGLTDKSQIG